MPSSCHECGAPLPDGGACKDLFHAMLLLEYEVLAQLGPMEGEIGKLAHYYAVSAYMIQHPESMGYNAEALAGARRGVAEHLAGRMTPDRLRQQIRNAVDGPARILRRPGDMVVRWAVESWPMNVGDVLAGGVPGYLEQVAAWAASVVQAIDAAGD